MLFLDGRGTVLFYGYTAFYLGETPYISRLFLPTMNHIETKRGEARFSKQL